MAHFTQYFGQFEGFRGGFGGLPSWARTIVGVFALPGLILLGLSLAAIVVSLAALLLLTLPVYSLLQRVCTPPSRIDPVTGAKRIEVTVVK